MTAHGIMNNTYQLQQMTNSLRAYGHEAEARETEKLISIVNRVSDNLAARIRDLAPVWKAVEWYASGDWGFETIKQVVEEHRKTHPEGAYVPGLPLHDWDPGARYGEPVKMRANCQGEWKPAHQAPPARPLTMAAESNQEDSPEEYATAYDHDELEWVHWATGEALRIQAERTAAKVDQVKARRAALMELFAGGPMEHPVPAMVHKAIDYIIEQETKA
jgi:hypothetical protein